MLCHSLMFLALSFMCSDEMSYCFELMKFIFLKTKNDQINKWVIHVVSCYPITNWLVFEFVTFYPIIIHVVSVL